jgi:hypothetical protein
MIGVQVGDTHDRWTVVGPVQHNRHGTACIPCRCACGTERNIERAKLLNGKTRSCGCLAPSLISAANRTHGHTLGGKCTHDYLRWVHQRAWHREPRGFIEWLAAQPVAA